MPRFLTQDWTHGNSGAAMQSSIYYQGSPNSDAPTTDYSQIYGSETVEVVGGKLGAWLGSGDPNPWTTAGIMLRIPGGPVDGSAGNLKIPITYTSDSISQVLDVNGGTSILVVLRAAVSGITALNVFLFKDGSDFKIQIGYRLTSDNTFHSTADITLDDTITAGLTDTWKLCWKCASDGTGYARVYRNGTLVGSVESINLTLKNTSGGANDLLDVTSGWEALPGGEGLAGYLGTVVVGTGCVDSSHNLLTGQSHTVTGSDNLIAGAAGTVTGDRNVLLALKDSGSPAPEITGNNTLKVCADTIDLETDSLLVNGSDLAQIYTATVTLTDAQIKALPTTAIQIVDAPSAGSRIRVLSATLSLDASSGAYTNINTTNAFLGLVTDGGFATIFAANDSATTPALTTVSDFLGVAADNLIDLIANVRPRGQVSTGVLYQQPRIFSTTYVAGALKVSLDNNGSGNLTGGNAANTLKVTALYLIETI
jgi:hypothetical protein